MSLQKNSIFLVQLKQQINFCCFFISQNSIFHYCAQKGGFRMKVNILGTEYNEILSKMVETLSVLVYPGVMPGIFLFFEKIIVLL